MKSSALLLDIDTLACGYRRAQPVLSDVTFAVRRGQVVALVGPSGCGKTTLLKTLLGLVPPLAGSVTVLGSSGGVPRGRVGYVPQRLGLVDHVSVLRNVVVGALPQTGPIRSLVGAFSHRHIQRAYEALDCVGLTHKAQQYPLRLSGGERRRVAIARTLMQQPDLWVGDEFLAELDDTTAQRVIEAVGQLRHDTGMGVLMVDHDLDRSCQTADLVCCIREGAVRAHLPRSPDRRALASAALAVPAQP